MEEKTGRERFKEKEETGREKFKKIEKKLRELEGKNAATRRDLLAATEQRQKLFGDIALGLVSPGEKPKINQKIKQLEGEREDLDITIKELELRKKGLERQGFDREW